MFGIIELREGNTANIFEMMDQFFDSEGSGYHRRSLGMLSLTTENAMNELKRSFEIEPLSVRESGEGNYLINTNGCHRFTVLRTLCLKELAEADNDPEKIEVIRRKYTIPAQITGIDLDKTYAKFVLSMIGSQRPDVHIIDMETAYTEDYRPTDDMVLVYKKDEERKRRTITKEQFIELARQALIRCPKDDPRLRYIRDGIDTYESFKEFIGHICPEYLEGKNSTRVGDDDERV